MARYVAFLRGMNLGNRRIKNDELRAEFEQLEFADVGTFRASGNVIFAASGGDGAADLAKKIESCLAASLGYEVAVFLRTAGEVEAIAAREPFEAKFVNASKGKLQVLLLGRKPAAAARKRCWRWRARRTAWRSRAASCTGCRAGARSTPTWT